MLFDNIKLEQEEVVLEVVRKHWFVIGLELFGAGILVGAPFLVLILASSLPDSLSVLSEIIFSHIPEFLFFSCIWILFSILTVFTIWTHYYLDLWVVTDRRIILIDQIHFFNRNVSIFRLERMQDIEYKVTGIIPTLLNFGTIKAQTAGAHESNFTSTGLPDPRGLQATIQSAMDKRMAALHITPDEVAGRH